MATVAGKFSIGRTSIRIDITLCAVLSIFSAAIAWRILGGFRLDLHDPILYAGDGIAHLTMIQDLIEGPWAYTSSRLGFPFGSVTYDYPLPDTGTLLALQALGRFSHSAGWAFNVYYFLGFALNAAAAYTVLRYMKLRRALCFLGAFVFTMLPFHFMRIHHLFYTWYFSAPIFTWYAIRVYKGELDFLKASTKQRLIDVAVLLALSCFGVYYAFFGCICILIASLAALLRSQPASFLRGGVVAVAIVFFGIVLNVSPTLIYQHKHGPDAEVANRLPIEAELYGIKITQLLLPSAYHRSEAIRKITQTYDSTFPLVNENLTSSLGVVGSVGFLGLLISVFAPPARRGDTLSVLAFLTFGLLVFCSIGGLSSLFAMFVSAKIRAWNRASIFIGFFSVSAVMLFAQPLLSRYKSAVVAVFVGLVCAFATWDQGAPPLYGDRQTWHAVYESDKEFTGKIEGMMPRGSAIYQLPYMPYPEGGPVNQLISYDPAAGYLNSKELRWSFGAMKGRDAGDFFKKLSTEPIEQQIQKVKEMGFSGIWIDRRGYADHGASIESQLEGILGEQPSLVSPNGNQSFFLLGRGQPSQQ